MIVDASALLAVVLQEPDAERYGLAILRAPRRQIPSVAWFEATLRVDPMSDPEGMRKLDAFVRDFGLEIVPFTADHAREARRARQLYGRPNPARLNFGDCMVYGVARHEREPLLFKGDDFSRTDIEPALKD